jgi:CheY-like chemotaxis protein
VATSLPLRVLVVDDYQDGRDLLTEYLTFRGFAVDAACDGAEAIAKAKHARPDLILMDLRMPGMDGWRATRALKDDPDTQSVPVIAVTAHALGVERQSARDAGCDAVISKPFDITALGDALPKFLELGASALEVPGLSLFLPQKARPGAI